MTVSRAFFNGITDKRAALRAVRNAHKSKGSKRGREPWIMNAEQREKELRALVAFRTAYGLNMGAPLNWAWVVGNLCRTVEKHITADMLQTKAVALGLPGFDAVIVDQVVAELSAKAWGAYKLYDPKRAGGLLMLTRAERDAAGIQKIEAIDESKDERRRRLAKERKQRERAAKAAPGKVNKSALARTLGVDRGTIRRWMSQGRIDAETGEIIDPSLSVTGSNNTPYSERVLPRDKTAAWEARP